jgi:hypothetical protein
MRSKPAGLLLGILLLLWLTSCSGPVETRAVTIAFPIGTYSSIAAIHEFQDVVDRDHKHMVRGSHLEGLPQPIVNVSVDADKLSAHAARGKVTKAGIIAALPQPLKWEISGDSLAYEAVTTDAQPLSLEDLALLIISQPNSDVVVKLRDVADIRVEERLDAVEVRGQKCIVLAGTTTRTQQELEDWLIGLDKQLGVQFFITLGEAKLP